MLQIEVFLRGFAVEIRRVQSFEQLVRFLLSQEFHRFLNGMVPSGVHFQFVGKEEVRHAIDQLSHRTRDDGWRLGVIRLITAPRMGG